MPRELLYIINQLRGFCRGSSTAHTFTEGDGLAGYFSLEGPKD